MNNFWYKHLSDTSHLRIQIAKIRESAWKSDLLMENNFCYRRRGNFSMHIAIEDVENIYVVYSSLKEICQF